MFYRLTPAEALALPGPEYLSLCYRAPAYQGAMAARAAAQEEERKEDEHTVPAERDAIEASPLAGLIDWGGSNGGT